MFTILNTLDSKQKQQPNKIAERENQSRQVKGCRVPSNLAASVQSLYQTSNFAQYEDIYKNAVLIDDTCEAKKGATEVISLEERNDQMMLPNNNEDEVFIVDALHSKQ